MGPGEFCLTFTQCSALVTLMDIVGKLLDYLEIKVVKDVDGFTGIKISKMDKMHVCFMVAKLECDVECAAGESPIFCVESKTFVPCLKAAPSHCSIDLCSDADSTNVRVVAYESVSKSYCSTYSVPTLVRDDEPVKLNIDAYEHNVEIDLNTLRSIVKNAGLLGGDLLTISLKKPTCPLSYDYTLVTISTDGRATQEHQFHSVTEKADDNSMRAICLESNATEDVPDVDEFREVYCGTFRLSFIQRFLSGMERQIITMSVSPNKPLYINYHLGSEVSYVCLVLAHNVSNE